MGLRALVMPWMGIDEHLHHALHNGHAAHVQVAAVALQPAFSVIFTRLSVLCMMKGAMPSPMTLPTTRFSNFMFPRRMRMPLFALNKKAQHPRGADGLRKDGSQRRAGNAHAEHENKHRVQHDINDRADEHAEHCNGGVALCADESVEAQSKLYENSTRQVNGDIVLRIADDGVGGARTYTTAAFLKMLKMTVSVTDSTRSMEKQLPRIFSAPSRLPAPSWMEASGAPPIPANAAKAETSRMMGNVTPTPVSASAPVPGMLPM